MSTSIEPRQNQKLHIPNAWNCLQGALYEMTKPFPNLNQAINCLEGAKRSLRATGCIQATDPPCQGQQSHYYVLELESGTELDWAIQRILSGAANPAAGVEGLRYSDSCCAQSLAEALAEFAKNGNCTGSLRLRLIVQQTMEGQ